MARRARGLSAELHSLELQTWSGEGPGAAGHSGSHGSHPATVPLDLDPLTTPATSTEKIVVTHERIF